MFPVQQWQKNPELLREASVRVRGNILNIDSENRDRTETKASEEKEQVSQQGQPHHNNCQMTNELLWGQLVSEQGTHPTHIYPVMLFPLGAADHHDYVSN